MSGLEKKKGHGDFDHVSSDEETFDAEDQRRRVGETVPLLAGLFRKKAISGDTNDDDSLVHSPSMAHH